MSDLNKCSKCGSKDIHHRFHSDGEINAVVCHSCGHDEPVYHITEKGKKILEILLDPVQKCSETADKVEK